MKKTLTLLSIIGIVASCVFVSGCEKKETKEANQTNELNNVSIVADGEKEQEKSNVEDYKYPGKENSEEVVFGCGNYNLNIYSDYSSSSSLLVDVYSYQKLSTEDVNVFIDIKTPYKVYVSEKEYDEAEHKQMIEQVLQDCNANISPEELGALDISSIPKINSYSLMINFDMSHEELDVKEEHFASMKVTINNKEYDVKVGNVKLLYGEIEQFPDYDEGEGVTGQTGGAVGFPVNPSDFADNTFEYSGFMFQTVKDIEITDIGVLGNNSLTMKSAIVQVSGDVSMEADYEKGKPIKVKKDSLVELYIQISDENIGNPLTYYSSAIVYMKYKDGGKEYTIINSPTFRANYYPYEVYAQAVDGVDVVGYYNALAD